MDEIDFYKQVEGKIIKDLKDDTLWIVENGFRSRFYEKLEDIELEHKEVLKIPINIDNYKV